MLGLSSQEKLGSFAQAQSLDPLADFKTTDVASLFACEGNSYILSKGS